MLPLSFTPITASKGLRTSALSLECHSARNITPAVLLSTDFRSQFSPSCLPFHLQGLRIVILSLSPFLASDRHFRHPSGFSSDFLTPESTVFRYRPRFPSVSTALPLTDMLPIASSGRLLLRWRCRIGEPFWGTKKPIGYTQLLTHRTRRKIH